MGNYGHMADVECFPFITGKKKQISERNGWTDKDYVTKRSHKLCFKHVVEGRSTQQHPYPELFSYNN